MDKEPTVGLLWHVHDNGRSHAFRTYDGKPVRLSVCGSLKLDKDPVAAPMVYPCCNCVRWTYTDRKTGKPFAGCPRCGEALTEGDDNHRVCERCGYTN